ncbi:MULTISPECIES: tyrosine--tRNA ligase [unclassified Acidiplasma]|uniref:tyrosine--tRNA ligase n=1 Tax=unclassified Acidiplasma TaxID=2641301 RepID=UPI0005DD9BAC|nr:MULTISPECIES: tyrosine--tRNA ligase [unclassified Acidiplasma]KJE49360.1 tyrosyl-tRNA synthetase [Acidiplasma sp. MBA-1]WMT54698.1 MAG: tyrosine--tRNA ligase [Acidiplasma sp.]
MENIELLKRDTSEIITEDEALDALKNSCKGYWGVEPSGLPHIATGILFTNKINDMVRAGIKMKVLLADWHARVNDKLGGDIEKIRESGELLKRTMIAAGLDSSVEFIWAGDLVSSRDYWEELLKVSKNSSLLRIRRALPIMGRTEEDADRDFSKYIYPLMQVTDIIYMDLDFALGGMDQRHAHMLQRDVAEKMGVKKVISVHMPLISSLKGSGRMDDFKKMSKSDPDSAIFITDSDEDIKRKIKHAYCPVGVTENNPVIDILKYVVFPYYQERLTINRPESKGGPVEVDFHELINLYENQKIHPVDLKNAAAESIINIIGPVREKIEGD